MSLGSLPIVQQVRAKKVYEPGTLVNVEYRTVKNGPEKKGYAKVLNMIAASVRTRGHKQQVPFARIQWMYTQEDLLAEESGPDEAALEVLGFEDGDLAYSNLEQDIEVHCIVGPMDPVPIRFIWDGAELRLSEQEEKEAEARLELTEGLPQHLHDIKVWLLADEPWKDQAVGAKWHYLIMRLLQMGRESNQATWDELAENFFETPGGEPLPGKQMTWKAVKEPIDSRCQACGMMRRIDHEWVEMGWQVGRHCVQRLEMLRSICAYMFERRAEAQASKPFLPDSFVKATHDRLLQLKGQASECLKHWSHSL